MHYLILFLVLFFFGCDKSAQKNEIVFPSADPLAKYQWHLKNNAIAPNNAKNILVAGEDINIEGIGYGKKSITVSVIDTGVQASHPDLEENLDLNRSFRFSDRSNNPTPLFLSSSGNAHGTACAGIIAASADNNIGIRGVAPNITLVGLNAGDLANDSHIAEALAYQNIDVSSNSWGSPDFFDESQSIDAISTQIVNGRSGKGTVYVFAPGNENENTQFQNILTTGYVIPVSALDGNGELTSYSAFGANILLSAYGGGKEDEQTPAIVTTDFIGLRHGYDRSSADHFEVEGNENGDYTRMMNGTSAAAPMVSGVVALMLSENANLTYRDVQYILATTARQNDSNNLSWFSNAASHRVSSLYGFGVLDANAAVEKAKSFQGLAQEKSIVKSVVVNKSVSNELEVPIVVDDNVNIEYIQIVLDLEHSNFKNLQVSLESAQKTVSLLSASGSTNGTFIAPWTFASVQFLDELSEGTWTLKITNTSNSGSGTLNAVTLKIRGY